MGEELREMVEVEWEHVRREIVNDNLECVEEVILGFYIRGDGGGECCEECRCHSGVGQESLLECFSVELDSFI